MATKTTEIRVVGKDEASKTFETISTNSAKATSAMEGHTARLGKAFGSLDSLLGQFGIPFTGALSTIGGKLEDFESKSTSALGNVAGAFGALGVGVGAAAAGIAIESIHLADGFEIAQSRLETAIKNSGGSFERLSPAIQIAYDKMARFGFNQTEVAGALATLTNLTRDPIRAIALLGDTANFSAEYNKDLATSAQAVGLAAEGQMGRLKRLVGDLGLTAGGTTALNKAQDAYAKAAQNVADVEQKVTDGRLKGPAATDALKKSYEQLQGAQQHLSDVQSAGGNILAALSERDMGAAERRSKTFAGELKGLQAELENLGVRIGLKLIPIVKQMAEALQQAITWVVAHKADFARAFDDVQRVVEAVWKVVGPIYKDLWQGFQDLVKLIDALIHGDWSKAWEAFKKLVGDQVDALIDYLKAVPGRILSALGDFARLLWQKGTDLISGLAAGIWNKFYDLAGDLADIPSKVVNAVGDLASTLWNAGWNLIAGFWNGIKASWNNLADLAEIHLPKIHIPWPIDKDFGGGTVDLLPHIASGTTNFAGGLAVVGEQGPELAYLPVGSGVMSAGQTANVINARGGGAGVGGDQTVVVKLLLDGKTIHEALLKRNRQTGSLRLT